MNVHKSVCPWQVFPL